MPTEPIQNIEAIFRRFVEEYQVPLTRMCCVYLHDRALAEDAVQETFLKAFRALPRFRGESSEKTWLMRIAINTCRDMQRSGWFRLIDRRVDPEQIPLCSHQESHTELVLAIAALSPKLREVVLLYYYQNLSVNEIAQILHIHHSSVSNRLSRAKQQLRSAMKGECFHE